jgi:hypothetical protein
VGKLAQAAVDTVALTPVGRCRALREDQSSPVTDSITAARRFADGWTIQVEGIELISPPYESLTAAVSRWFDGAPVRANVYVTPPQARPAVRKHRDASSALVLQLSGMKEWSVWSPAGVNSSWLTTAIHENEYGKDLITSDDPPALRQRLSVGDALWLPRGAAHCTRVFDIASVHTTLMIFAPTMNDLLQHVLLEFASEILQLSDEVGFDLCDTDLSKGARTLRQVADLLEEQDPLKSAAPFWLRWMARYKRGSGLTLPTDKDLRGASRLVLSNAPLRLFGNCVVVAPGIAIEATIKQREVVETLLDRADGLCGTALNDAVNEQSTREFLELLIDCGVVRPHKSLPDR